MEKIEVLENVARYLLIVLLLLSFLSSVLHTMGLVISIVLLVVRKIK